MRQASYVSQLSVEKIRFNFSLKLVILQNDGCRTDFFGAKFSKHWDALPKNLKLFIFYLAGQLVYVSHWDVISPSKTDRLLPSILFWQYQVPSVLLILYGFLVSINVFVHPMEEVCLLYQLSDNLHTLSHHLHTTSHHFHTHSISNTHYPITFTHHSITISHHQFHVPALQR